MDLAGAPFSITIGNLFVGTPLPDLLRSVCEYVASFKLAPKPQETIHHRVPFGREFELLWRSDFDPVAGWCRRNEKKTAYVKQRFKVFGRDAAGSLYGLWIFKRGVTAEQAPVAVLDAEFIEDSVVAANLRDFLGYLAADENSKYDNAAFREWLAATHGIKPLDATVADAARKSYPQFAHWTQRNIGKSF